MTNMFLFSAVRSAVGEQVLTSVAHGMFTSPIYKGMLLAASAAFVIGDWTLTNPATDGDLTVTITTLPTTTEPISDIEYRVDGGSWISSGVATTTSFIISGLTNTVSYAVEIQAVNRFGASAISDTKNATPTV